MKKDLNHQNSNDRTKQSYGFHIICDGGLAGDSHTCYYVLIIGDNALNDSVALSNGECLDILAEFKYGENYKNYTFAVYDENGLIDIFSE